MCGSSCGYNDSWKTKCVITDFIVYHIADDDSHICLATQVENFIHTRTCWVGASTKFPPAVDLLCKWNHKKMIVVTICAKSNLLYPHLCL